MTQYQNAHMEAQAKTFADNFYRVYEVTIMALQDRDFIHEVADKFALKRAYDIARDLERMR